MKGFVLGGVSSGVGKTVATLSILQALEDAGHEVQPAKAGPDFIDPSHHEAIADRPSRTLDLWLEGEDGLRRNYRRGEGDICVVEGVMGLYDGDGSSTAMVAEALDVPVVLVVDAKAGMESVAATALGFREYAATIGRDIEVAGVIAQRAHGGRHEQGIRDALPDDLEFFGRIPPNDDLEIPDRHLGLEMGKEAALPTAAVREAAESLEADRLAAVASEPPAPRRHRRGPRARSRSTLPSPSPATRRSVSGIRRPSNGSASELTPSRSRRSQAMLSRTRMLSICPAATQNTTPRNSSRRAPSRSSVTSRLMGCRYSASAVA